MSSFFIGINSGGALRVRRYGSGDFQIAFLKEFLQSIII